MKKRKNQKRELNEKGSGTSGFSALRQKYQSTMYPEKCKKPRKKSPYMR